MLGVNPCDDDSPQATPVAVSPLDRGWDGMNVCSFLPNHAFFPRRPNCILNLCDTYVEYQIDTSAKPY